ncbi:MAG TPA: alpha/beta fold hydrolase [Candidatus Agrococcus pullicola]|uniref:Alpha/beta fold hydrolase n=1 Tax=Candidatus Agrococcus pullicola TaxID=2838429 RepID=A0A9D1YV86_9MICO|nr:alpha/beta fold hydrolase [Candidatus Agrococcus pullicola]
MTNTFEGIEQRKVATRRITANVLHRTGDGVPVVFIHGNVSSSLFFQPAMLGLDRESFAIDLRGFGESDALAVDATRGLRDFSDDVAAVLDALGVEHAHLVGWSMGGGVVAQLLIDRPELITSLTLIATVPPFGFGTRVDGKPMTEDGAGTGGLGVNQEFVGLLASGETGEGSQSAPRSVFRSSYVAPGFADDHEDVWVAAMLSTKTGEDNYPGNGVTSEHWPGFAAGDSGVLNAMSGKHLDWSAIEAVEPKPPILWLRGAHDVIVGDESLFDFNTLGKLGVVPDWPGDEVAPPTPMLAQTRRVLERYGPYEEVVFEDAGHSPHLEQPERFLEVLERHIR